MIATTKEIDDYISSEESRHKAEDHDDIECSNCKQIKQSINSRELHKFSVENTRIWLLDAAERQMDPFDLIASAIANAFTWGLQAGIAISEKKELEKLK